MLMVSSVVIISVYCHDVNSTKHVSRTGLQ